ncbi:hypothetical protein [Roseococcus pinisoli]|uniref:Uncharacterized protein n=1 Tax=Roseococcus pinisoli TaxID=2835040 RepID=A0ABS5QH23_9PROT|nr:hypothetical protein [Roseococcus pinisoli]MBS7812984.1 hypothetical protein [Roseococcus pinisoli]
MRGFNPLPAARRRCVTAGPAKRTERLPDAASFYEPPRSLEEPEGRNAEDRLSWHSQTVTWIGPKE